MDNEMHQNQGEVQNEQTSIGKEYLKGKEYIYKARNAKAWVQNLIKLRALA